MKLFSGSAAACFLLVSQQQVNAFSTVAPPVAENTQVQQKFKITWELDVEERIRRSLDDGHLIPGGMPYLVAVAGIPGR